MVEKLIQRNSWFLSVDTKQEKLPDISSYLIGEDSAFGSCTAEGDKNMSRLYKRNLWVHVSSLEWIQYPRKVLVKGLLLSKNQNNLIRGESALCSDWGGCWGHGCLYINSPGGARKRGSHGSLASSQGMKKLSAWVCCFSKCQSKGLPLPGDSIVRCKKP